MSRFSPVRRTAAAVVTGVAVTAGVLGAATAPALAKTNHQKPRTSPSATRTSPSAPRTSPSATRTSPSAPRTSPSATRTSPSATRTSPSATSGSAAETASGNYYAGNLAVQFSAARAAGAAADQATGTFSAQMQVGSGDVLTLSGPVTCLDENGPYIGLFYPVTSSSPSLIGAAMKGVYISLEMGRDGQPLSMSFRPSEASGVSSCAPAPGVIPILSGTASETD